MLVQGLKYSAMRRSAFGYTTWSRIAMCIQAEFCRHLLCILRITYNTRDHDLEEGNPHPLRFSTGQISTAHSYNRLQQVGTWL